MKRLGKDLPSGLGVTASVSDAATPVMDEAVLRSLAQKPQVAVPEDFATRVSAYVLAQPRPRRFSWMGWGARLGVLSAGLLTAGMFALAPHAVPSLSNAAFDGELLLLAELSGLLLCSRYLLVRD